MKWFTLVICVHIFAQIYIWKILLILPKYFLYSLDIFKCLDGNCDTGKLVPKIQKLFRNNQEYQEPAF